MRVRVGPVIKEFPRDSENDDARKKTRRVNSSADVPGSPREPSCPPQPPLLSHAVPVTSSLSPGPPGSEPAKLPPPRTPHALLTSSVLPDRLRDRTEKTKPIDWNPGSRGRPAV